MRLARPVPARNLSSTILYSSVRSVIALALIVGGTTAASAFGGFSIQQPDRVIEAGQIRALETPDPVAALIRIHGCWRQNETAPVDMAGQFPTHAIVGGKYVGKRLADLAFDQEIGGHDHGLDVSAFCR